MSSRFALTVLLSLVVLQLALALELVATADCPNNCWVVAPVVGPTGPAGQIGERGERGVQGFPGVDGRNGTQGIKGDAGPRGEKGDKGDTGERGLQGDAGIKGANGIDGRNGTQGVKGDTGSIGPQGPKGDTGPQGLKGDTGPQGLKGDVGPIGPAGIRGTNGTNGTKGDKGDKGDQGIQGIQGIQGPTGATATDYEYYRMTAAVKGNFVMEFEMEFVRIGKVVTLALPNVQKGGIAVSKIELDTADPYGPIPQRFRPREILSGGAPTPRTFLIHGMVNVKIVPLHLSVHSNGEMRCWDGSGTSLQDFPLTSMEIIPNGWFATTVQWVTA